MARLIAIFGREQMLDIPTETALEMAGRTPGTILSPGLFALRQRGKEALVREAEGTLPLSAFDAPLTQVDVQEIAAGYRAGLATHPL